MAVNRRSLIFLDSLRGLAALYVMVDHAAMLLWEGPQSYHSHPAEYSFINRILAHIFPLFRFGNYVVFFFFVLSGFLIHLKYANNLASVKSARFSFPEYFKRRAKRIYPPFIFALILCYLLDTTGMRMNLSIYSSPTLYNFNIPTNHSTTAFVGNLFFLFGEYVPLFGSNSPTWTLKLEWWFYMIYPILLFISKRNIYPASILMAALFIASYFPHVWPEPLLLDVFAYMLFWWLGVLLAEVYVRRIKISMKMAMIVFFSVAAVLFPCQKYFEANEIIGAFFVAGIISLIFYLQEKGVSLARLAKLKWLGDCSYTLYILHWPFFVLCSGMIMNHNQGHLPKNFLFVFLGIIAALCGSYLLHFVTETPFLKQKPKIIPVEQN
jgi:peptidoglycan/LPS O-acetylase OafA/YrhL